VVNDLSARRAEAVAAEINGSGRKKKAIALQADVSRADAVEAMVAAAKRRFGPINILVNNAGIGQIRPFLDISPADWQRMLDVHVKGSFLCARAVLPDMIAAGWGRIINTSSVAGMTGTPSNSSYATAKAAIIGFTKALAYELGRTGVTVNAVAPGAIDNILRPEAEADPEGTSIPGELVGETGEKVVRYFMRRIPMRRLGSPEDIAFARLYLASDEAAYVTGQVLSPNGGFVI
jgi:NAD(P)-dependent dehydrogenase (short-subunit alcohol dehydrogenase family)